MNRATRWAAMTALALCAQAQEWKPLFDGKTLAGWRASGFRNEPPAKVQAGILTLEAGHPMTGVTFAGEFPKDRYEIRFEAARLKGGDFFASLTFPVGESFMTWVTGGWGGDIVGLSSIDGWDAADNETRQYYNFEIGRYYQFKLAVDRGKIQGWIDDQRIINVDIQGREVGLRPGDIKLSVPLGFASYNTTGGIRKIEYRPLK